MTKDDIEHFELSKNAGLLLCKSSRKYIFAVSSRKTGPLKIRYSQESCWKYIFIATKSCVYRTEIPDIQFQDLKDQDIIQIWKVRWSVAESLVRLMLRGEFYSREAVSNSPHERPGKAPRYLLFLSSWVSYLKYKSRTNRPSNIAIFSEQSSFLYVSSSIMRHSTIEKALCSLESWRCPW